MQKVTITKTRIAITKQHYLQHLKLLLLLNIPVLNAQTLVEQVWEFKATELVYDSDYLDYHWICCVFQGENNWPLDSRRKVPNELNTTRNMTHIQSHSSP